MNNNLYLIVPFFNFFKNSHRILNLKAFLLSKQNIYNLKIILVEGFCEGYSEPLPSFFKKMVDKYVIYKIPQPLFVKENLINVAIRDVLPNDWEYLCWIDSDIIYENNEWVNDTIEKLKTNDLVQMFSIGFDQMYSQVKKYVHKYGIVYYNKIENKNLIFSMLNPEMLSHPGFAWAINRNFYNKIEKLWDLNILGGGDSIMSKSIHNLCADLNNFENYYYSDSFKNELEKYIKNFELCKYNFINHHIFHLFHGETINRNYVSRHNILKRYNYDKSFLNFTNDGILYLKNDELLNEIISYFKVKEFYY